MLSGGSGLQTSTSTPNKHSKPESISRASRGGQGSVIKFFPRNGSSIPPLTRKPHWAIVAPRGCGPAWRGGTWSPGAGPGARGRGAASRAPAVCSQLRRQGLRAQPAGGAPRTPRQPAERIQNVIVRRQPPVLLIWRIVLTVCSQEVRSGLVLLSSLILLLEVMVSNSLCNHPCFLECLFLFISSTQGSSFLPGRAQRKELCGCLAICCNVS
ncbi:uncharacterized protein LOC116538152 [Sapajus apella]|uniref:Uncharacterized protein LOC116538152 n=1 Tax=Sapajus apella TaxID=9515 RepID=A0A6J3GEA3_SAPAP|nr:uncharacterized protein LOC116538152 [Sapajus apella]